jgi:ABC-type proline/glycine betaine transport system ATPase subunit
VLGSHEDEIIAVMGITGVGKSTFIEHLTKVGLKIGHSLQSCERSDSLPEADLTNSG